jgi:hypothetical protein
MRLMRPQARTQMRYPLRFLGGRGEGRVSLRRIANSKWPKPSPRPSPIRWERENVRPSFSDAQSARPFDVYRLVGKWDAEFPSKKLLLQSIGHLSVISERISRFFAPERPEFLPGSGHSESASGALLGERVRVRGNETRPTRTRGRVAQAQLMWQKLQTKITNPKFLLSTFYFSLSRFPFVLAFVVLTS